MTIEDAYKFYTGEIGISADEFYDSTPYELELKAKGHLEAKKNSLRLKTYAISVGINNVLNKKKIDLFDTNTGTKEITKEEKQKELEYLKQRFK